MQDIVNKVCSTLITNPHVIGIILNCSRIPGILQEDKEIILPNVMDMQGEKRIDLCIISKEAGNQKIIHMENDFIVCLRWRTVDQFVEVFDQLPPRDYQRVILYDKTGMLLNMMGRQRVRVS